MHLFCRWSDIHAEFVKFVGVAVPVPLLKTMLTRIEMTDKTTQHRGVNKSLGTFRCNIYFL